jgi:predicted Rossmann fold flavoprotein
MNKKIAIIGGGAAGMMAAAAIAGTATPEVMLFERNAYLGAKVIISGGGRCNVTTGIFDIKKLLQNYPRGSKFLMSALYRFPPEKVMEWFEKHGVSLKIEKDLRVFPVSDNGKDIVAALEKKLREAGVQIYLRAPVTQIKKVADGFQITLQSGQMYTADYVVLTTGGNAYSHTGSKGDGYHFAKELGHSVTELAPSLNSFVLAEPFVSGLAGVSMEKVSLRFESLATKKLYSREGPILFTHKGITGPAIFALSAQSAYEKYSKDQPLSLKINFFPDMKIDQLKVFIRDLANKNGKKSPVNFLDIFLPKSLSVVFAKILDIDPTLKVAQLKKEHLSAILELIQNFTVTVIGRGAGDEFVTAGGVSLEEVNTNTMASKICPGLYFAGEILDIDGFTGGFNLQASWATGRLAGENIILTIDTND